MTCRALEERCGYLIFKRDIENFIQKHYCSYCSEMLTDMEITLRDSESLGFTRE